MAPKAKKLRNRMNINAKFMRLTIPVLDSFALIFELLIQEFHHYSCRRL